MMLTYNRSPRRSSVVSVSFKNLELYVKSHCLNIATRSESPIKLLGMLFIIDTSVLLENSLLIKFIQSSIWVPSDVIHILNSEVIKDFILHFFTGFQYKEWFCAGNNQENYSVSNLKI